MNGMKPISVLTFGSGAVGTYIGGSLALAGHKVTFIEQPSVAADLRLHGLRLDVTIDKARKAAEPFIVSPNSIGIVSSLEAALSSDLSTLPSLR